MEKLIDKLEKLILRSYNDDDAEQSVRTIEMINICVRIRKALGLHNISGSAEDSAQITKTANSECINQCFNCCNRHFDGIINGQQINTCLRFNKNIANIYEEGCEKWNERN